MIWDAINQVIDNYSNVRTEIDIPKFINDCMSEFKKLDLPYFKIYESKYEKNTIVFEVPFIESLEIKFKSASLQFRYKKTASLFVNGKELRKIQLVSLEPKYIAKIAEALLDYLRKYCVLRNKFKQSSSTK